MKNIINVVIACHNSEEFLSDAVESVVNQTLKNFDITIVDDGSVDKTSEVANSLIKKWSDYNIRLIQTGDIGPVRARTKALEDVGDEYILFLDGDDKIHPNFLQNTVRTLLQNPDRSFCYTGTQLFGLNNGVWQQPDYNFHALLMNNYISYCSLISRKAFDFVGGYDPNNYGYYEDYQLWIDFGRYKLYGIYLPENLFYYRIREGNSSSAKRIEQFDSVYKSYIILQYPEVFPREWKQKANLILEHFPDNFMAMNHEQQMGLKR